MEGPDWRLLAIPRACGPLHSVEEYFSSSKQTCVRPQHFVPSQGHRLRHPASHSALRMKSHYFCLLCSVQRQSFFLTTFLLEKFTFHFTYQLQFPSISPSYPHPLLRTGKALLQESTRSGIPTWDRTKPLPLHQGWPRYSTTGYGL